MRCRVTGRIGRRHLRSSTTSRRKACRATPFLAPPPLPSFANAKCAQDFQDYVGISYLDSSLFFTYLLPSARGWEQDTDRAVICFLTTTGAQLTASAKASRL